LANPDEGSDGGPDAAAIIAAADGGVAPGFVDATVVPKDAGDGSAPIKPDGAPPVDAGPPPDATVAVDPPILTTATAQWVGRWGDNLRISLKGTDAKGYTTTAKVSFSKADGTAIPAFDSNFDDVPDSAETFRVLDDIFLGKTDITATLTLPQALAKAPNLGQVTVALRNIFGQTSKAIEIPLVAQPEVALGASCDPQLVANRCPPSAYCDAASSLCKTPGNPQITRSAYYAVPGGTLMLFGGTAPAQDLDAIQVGYFDKQDRPVLVDGAYSSEIKVTDQRLASPFVVKNNAVALFATQVPRIVVTPRDKASRLGTPVKVDLAPPPQVSVGLPCDVDGFDACINGFRCANAGATNTCKSVSTLRAGACSGAFVLQPSKGIRTGYALARGPSAWEPPAGCTSEFAVGRPEAVFQLRLAAKAPTLVLSTELPETLVDTVIYVLPACGDVPATAVDQCNDDTVGSTSTLTLTNVEAGDYIVVVDTVEPPGGPVGLTVRLP
jgi:hypothetical protein